MISTTVLMGMLCKIVMKTLLLILTIGIISCSTNKSPENQVYDCWIESFRENGVDLTSEIKDFENDLIKNGYLKDNSWTSYKRLLDSLSQDTMPMIGVTILMENFAKATFKVDSQCYDSTLISQIPKLSSLYSDFEKGIYNKELGYQFIYSKISSTIDYDDFGSELYKTWINWILITNSIYSNWLKDLLPKENPNDKISMIIRIDSLTNYFIDNKKVDLKTIESEINKLGKSDNKIKIGLQVHESVTLDKVVEIMNICRKNKIKIKMESGK